MAIGNAWVVNTDGEVWVVQPQGGGKLMAPQGSAIQVALGFDNIPWILSSQRSNGAGNIIQFYNNANSSWQSLSSSIGATQIAGSTNGFCWFVDENNTVWSVDINGTLFQSSPANFAISVGVSSVGPAWVISTQASSGSGNLIQWFNNANGQWETLAAPAAGVQIAGQYDQTAWVVDTSNAIYNYPQSGAGKLVSPAGSALQVGIGPDMTPWMISTQNTQGPGGNDIFYFANGVWTMVPAPAAAIWVAGSM